MYTKKKHFIQIFGAEKCTRRKNILYRYLGQKDATWLREIKKYEWEEQTDTSTDFSQKAEEVIQEDSELESPWTRSGPRVLAEEFYQLT